MSHGKINLVFFLPCLKTESNVTKHMTHPISVNMAWLLEFCLLSARIKKCASIYPKHIQFVIFFLSLVNLLWLDLYQICQYSEWVDILIKSYLLIQWVKKKFRAKKKKLLKKQSSPAKILILKVKLLNILSWRLHVPEMVNLPHCNILWSMTVWVPNLSGFHFLLFGWFCQREACNSGLLLRICASATQRQIWSKEGNYKSVLLCSLMCSR